MENNKNTDVILNLTTCSEKCMNDPIPYYRIRLSDYYFTPYYTPHWSNNKEIKRDEIEKLYYLEICSDDVLLIKYITGKYRLIDSTEAPMCTSIRLYDEIGAINIIYDKTKGIDNRNLYSDPNNITEDVKCPDNMYSSKCKGRSYNIDLVREIEDILHEIYKGDR